MIQRAIEVINSLPQLPLWLALGAIFPAEWSPLTVYFCVTIVLSLIGWTGLARVVRGKILSLREEDYAVAARLLGASHARVLFRHLVPGFTSHIIVSLTLSVPGMILGETVLSFLGLGLRPPIVSWGVMLQACRWFIQLFQEACFEGLEAVSARLAPVVDFTGAGGDWAISLYQCCNGGSTSNALGDQ